MSINIFPGRTKLNWRVYMGHTDTPVYTWTCVAFEDAKPPAPLAGLQNGYIAYPSKWRAAFPATVEIHGGWTFEKRDVDIGRRVPYDILGFDTAHGLGPGSTSGEWLAAGNTAEKEIARVAAIAVEAFRVCHQEQKSVFKFSKLGRAAEVFVACDELFRFVAGLNLQDHPVKEQRECERIMRRVKAALMEIKK